MDVTLTWTITCRLLQTTYSPSWQGCFLMAVASFSRIIHPATLQNGLRNMTSSSCSYIVQIIQIAIWIRIFVLDQQIQSMEAPTSELVWLKGSAANVSESQSHYKASLSANPQHVLHLTVHFDWTIFKVYTKKKISFIREVTDFLRQVGFSLCHFSFIPMVSVNGDWATYNSDWNSMTSRL